SNDFKASVMFGLMSPTSPEPLRRETAWVYSQGAPPVFKGDLYYFSVDHDLRATARDIDTSRVAVYLLTGEYDWAATPPMSPEVARHCLLDFLGCALAGSREPLTDILVASVAQDGAPATLIGRRERAPWVGAALVNGAAGHALDFDDTHTVMSGHPSAPVVPALLALVESEGARGPDLLAALVAGIELECRLGALLGPGHYAAGFPATATLGA